MSKTQSRWSPSVPPCPAPAHPPLLGTLVQPPRRGRPARGHRWAAGPPPRSSALRLPLPGGPCHSAAPLALLGGPCTTQGCRTWGGGQSGFPTPFPKTCSSARTAQTPCSPCKELKGFRAVCCAELTELVAPEIALAGQVETRWGQPLPSRGPLRSGSPQPTLPPPPKMTLRKGRKADEPLAPVPQTPPPSCLRRCRAPGSPGRPGPHQH